MGRHPAIIGADVVTALGAGVDEVWAEMMRRTCGIRPMTRCARGRYTTDVAGEIPPDVEARIGAGAGEESWAYLLALAAARGMTHAVAGGGDRLAASRTGLVLASTKAEIRDLERLADGEEAGRRHNPYELARDLAEALGLAGPVMTVSNACASGLIAIVQAARLLRRGDAEMVVVVGVDVLAEFILAGFSALNALSPLACRPFDAERDGLSLGEGAAAVLLTLAPRRDDTILGEVAGWGVTNDACHITAPSRTGAGLEAAIVGALASAGVEPGDIHCINGHGTATVYNDAMEAKAVYRVFGRGMPPLSSMKGYFGHTLGAAGVIEVALTLRSMREGVVPACLGLRTLGVDAPVRVPTEHLRVPRLSNALSIKSGFGGVNAALVLTEGGPRG